MFAFEILMILIFVVIAGGAFLSCDHPIDERYYLHDTDGRPDWPPR
jgi:hypothetical protein